MSPYFTCHVYTKYACLLLSYDPGVKKIEFDMDNQKVFVESTLGSEELLAKIKKTGRECSYVGVKE